MKKLVLLFLLLCSSLSMASEDRIQLESLEDTIVLTDGTHILGKVNAVGDYQVSYFDEKKRKNKQLGRKYVASILYDDGRSVDCNDVSTNGKKVRVKSKGSVTNVVMIVVGSVLGILALLGLIALIQFLLWLN